MSEYPIPPLSELLSPAALEALADECENNEKIYDLLEAWGNPDRRQEMHEWAIDFLERQAEYQIRDENTLYIAIYGPRGTGKSEIAQRLAFFIIGVYQEHEVNILPVPKVARSPSDANDTFGEETEKGNTICLILDEKERQVSTASKTNLEALVQNTDTMRALRHSMLMIAITKDELGKLISRCEIVFRAIFKDRANRVNWCIMYVNDMEAKRLLPMAIVGIELHPYDKFRELYEKDKHKRQVKLTVDRGRSTPEPKKVVELAAKLIMYLTKRRITDPRAGAIRELLLTEIPGGKELIGEEKEAVVNRTIRLMKEKKKAPSPKTEMVWVGDEFDWKVRISNILKDSVIFPEEYWKVWYVTEVESLALHKDRKKVERIVGMAYGLANRWKRRMDKDAAYQGWVKQARGEMFEDFLSKRFEVLGYEVQRKPKVVIDDKEYEEDMLVSRDGQALYINAKCGTGYANYPADDYKTTHLIKTRLMEPAWIVYYDYAAGVYSVYDPAEGQMNVGSAETTSLLTHESAELENLGKDADATTIHSTPTLLRAILNNTIKPPWGP